MRRFLKWGIGLLVVAGVAVGAFALLTGPGGPLAATISAQTPDQVQRALGRGRRAGCRPCVSGDLGVHQHDAERLVAPLRAQLGASRHPAVVTEKRPPVESHPSPWRDIGREAC